jgi:4-hydroxybenzoate polyprenyltransferase
VTNIHHYYFVLVFFAVNDVYDYETDRRNSRKLADGLEGTVLNPRHHKDVLVAASLSATSILLSATVTQCRDNILASVLLVFVIWQYSSPPLRMKEIPVIDSLSNGCIGFLIWFFGFSYGGSTIFEVPVTAIMISFCGVGIHALAAAVDVEADVAGGQITIGTVFGKRPAAIYGFVCL